MTAISETYDILYDPAIFSRTFIDSSGNPIGSGEVLIDQSGPTVDYELRGLYIIDKDNL